ncbi:MAG: hypothetical protein NC313_09070 [Butyrivibrio sp.]|nr:hypothetical protein [Butyrivibrio sp.]
MKMKYIVLLFGIATCMILCTGCSSPYLPHNALKYIPEFYYGRNIPEEKDDSFSEENIEGGKTVMAVEPLSHRSYFSPDSIRSRYAEHIENESIEGNDPLLYIARGTVELMRQNGKSEEEIRLELKNKYHFTDKIIDSLVEK